MEFTSEDIIRRLNLADLAEYGDFRGEYIEYEPEDPETITAHGTLILQPRHLDGETVEVEGDLEIELDPFPEGFPLEDATAGQIFHHGWKRWSSIDIPEDWEF